MSYNREYHTNYMRKWRQTHRSECALSSAKSYRRHRKSRIVKSKLYRQKNIAKVRLYHAAYMRRWNKNRRVILLPYLIRTLQSYLIKGPPQPTNTRGQNNQWYRAYSLRKYHSDPVYKLRKMLRNRLRIALKKRLKKGSAPELVGCSMEELRFYLEGKFQDGMTWENWKHDGWHIDHIIPLAYFDLTDPTQLRQACHYTNLQPLWARANQLKGSKLPECRAV